MWKPKLAAAIGMGIVLMTRSREGDAQKSVCELVPLEAAASLDARWQRAVDRLRGTLAHELTGPECASLRLWVEPSTEGVVVKVQSSDGRETTRPVRDPRALAPVVLGLLASAPVEHGPASHPDALPARQFASPGPVDRDPRDLSDLPIPGALKGAAPASVDVTLGISTGVRVGVPTDVAMWDTELRADVLLRNWSILVFMRYAPLAAVSGIAPDTDAYQEMGVGFGVGREFRWGRHTLDVTASPSVVFVTLEADSPMEEEGELAQFRFNAAARYGYGLGRGWRFTLTLDSEAAPSSLIKARYADPALPPVPAWTVGFRLGAAASLL